MDEQHTVKLSRALHQAVQTWSPDEQAVLYGLKVALEEDGLDAVCGAGLEEVEGIFGVHVEHHEPGETIEMVWIRVFLDVNSQPSTVFVRFGDPGILLTDS